MCQAFNHICSMKRCLDLHLGASNNFLSTISNIWLSSSPEYLYWKSHMSNSERSIYSLHCTLLQMEAGTWAGGWLGVKASCWWPVLGTACGDPRLREGSPKRVVCLGQGRGKAFPAVGQLEAATMGREEQCSGAVVLTTALGCTASWLLGGSPGAASLAWGQEGWGRLREVAWALGNCSLSWEQLRVRVSWLGHPAVWLGQQEVAAEDNWWTRSVSWLSWALMVWFSCMMCISQSMDVIVLQVHFIWGNVSQCTCCWQKLALLADLFPFGVTGPQLLCTHGTFGL